MRTVDAVTTPLLGDVYIVLDLQGEAADAVMAVRRRFSYDYLGALPVEITITGSGGVGSPKDREHPERLFEALDAVASSTRPIAGRFGPAHRFPDSDVFVFLMEDPEPMVVLHRMITESSIAFDDSPFDFVPHCTLSQKPHPTDAEATALLEASVDAPFTAAMLSVYEMETFPLLRLRYRAYLSD
jgi:2'-5' RNA ligase